MVYFSELRYPLTELQTEPETYSCVIVHRIALTDFHDASFFHAAWNAILV